MKNDCEATTLRRTPDPAPERRWGLRRGSLSRRACARTATTTPFHGEEAGVGTNRVLVLWRRINIPRCLRCISGIKSLTTLQNEQRTMGEEQIP